MPAATGTAAGECAVAAPGPVIGRSSVAFHAASRGDSPGDPFDDPARADWRSTQPVDAGRPRSPHRCARATTTSCSCAYFMHAAQAPRLGTGLPADRRSQRSCQALESKQAPALCVHMARQDRCGNRTRRSLRPVPVWLASSVAGSRDRRGSPFARGCRQTPAGRDGKHGDVRIHDGGAVPAPCGGLHRCRPWIAAGAGCGSPPPLTVGFGIGCRRRNGTCATTASDPGRHAGRASRRALPGGGTARSGRRPATARHVPRRVRA